MAPLPLCFFAHGKKSERGGRGDQPCWVPQFGEGGDLGSQGETGAKSEQAEEESEDGKRRRQLSRGRGQEQGVRGNEAR